MHGLVPNYCINEKVFYHIRGSEALEKADIIFITQYDEKLITNIWQDHLLLLQNFSCEQKIDIQRFSPNFLKGIKLEVEGWDLINIVSRLDLLNERAQVLRSLWHEIQQDKKKKNWTRFQDSNSAFAKFMKFTPSDIQGQKEKILYKLSNKTELPNGLRGEGLMCFKFALEMIKDYVFQLYRNELREIFQERINNLKQALEKGLQSGRKMIVIIDAIFIPKCTPMRTNDDVIMEEYLKDKNFTIIQRIPPPKCIQKRKQERVQRARNFQIKNKVSLYRKEYPRIEEWKIKEQKEDQ